MVNKEEIELKETLFSEKKSNEGNGYNDLIKNGVDEKKQSS